MKATLLPLLLVFLLAGCQSAPTPMASPAQTAPPAARPTPAVSTPAAAAASPPAAPAGALMPLAAGLERLGPDAFFDESYKRLLQRNPEYVTTMGLTPLLGIGNDRLTDVSDGYQRETWGLERAILELLRRHDRARLTPAQRLTADVYDWYLDDRVRGQAFAYDDYPVNATIFSVDSDLLLFLTDIHPVRTAQEARDYVTRLSQVRVKYEQVIAGLQQREQTGVVLPRFLIPVVVGRLRAVADASPTETPFYTAFAGKVNALTTVGDAEKRALLADAEEQIAISVVPAHKLLADYLERQRAEATDDAGIGLRPDGAAYYAYLLRHHTTTNLTADQIHELGKRELQRIHAEMRQQFGALGYDTSQGLPVLYRRLAEDGGMVSGGQIVATYEQLIRGADERLATVFDRKPQAKVIVIGGPTGGYYTPPAADGSRPGAFYAQATGAVPKYTMASLAYHEAVPGHHFQLALAQESNLPLLRRDMGFTGHVEGWALYAERLAQEMGLYAQDAYGDLGRLQMEAFRAARLVVDTGLHAKRWSFDQAVDYMAENTGRQHAAMEAEVARYVSIPGQATAYYVGFLKVLELRARAQNALGDRFDLREFHNVLLVNGTVPLDVLERLVDDYIQATRARRHVDAVMKPRTISAVQQTVAGRPGPAPAADALRGEPCSAPWPICSRRAPWRRPSSPPPRWPPAAGCWARAA